MTKHSIMLVDARERIADRFKVGGDKWEQIKADAAWEKAHKDDDVPVCCSCHIVAPCSWCVKNLSEDE